MVAPETPEVVPTGTKSGLIPLLLIAGILVLVAAAGVAAWYFVRVKPGPKLAPVVAAPESAAPQPEAPAAAEPTPAPETAEPAPSEAPRPKAARTKKAAATAAGQPAAIAPTAQIAGLQNLSREAYAKGNYAEPAGANAISYSKQVLSMDPNNDYSKKLLENAVLGGKYQVQQAIAKKDLATAHRIANAMIQQLPNRSDVAGLKEDIAGAERATGTPKAPAATAGVSYRVYHMHTDKAPGDRGPYCAGTLSVVGDHLKFEAQSATDGQPHSYDFACSDVREIKKNARVGARQGGFHVRTTQSNYNFVPADGLSAPAGPLSSACSK